jgi:hypothetical protein
MKKLLLLPITIPLGMARGAVEGALHTAAAALHDLAGARNHADDDVATVTRPPATAAPAAPSGGREEGAVVDLDLGAAAPRRRPAARPPRPAPAAEPPAPAPEAPASPSEVAEDLGLREGHVGDDEPTLVESEGAAAPGPELEVDEPWPGYRSMRATAIVQRLRGSDDATKAIVRLYERQHRNRRTVIAATEG